MWMFLGAALATCGEDLAADLDALADDPEIDALAIDAALACHADPLDPGLAARVHGLYARAWASDVPRAAQHLYAAWEAQPFLAPALPAGHPANEAFRRMQEGEAPPPLASPEPFLKVDGLASTWVREGQPYVAQVPGRPGVRSDGTQPFRAPIKRERNGSGWLVAGLATGAVASGMYAGAWVSRDRYEEQLATNGPDDARQRSYDWTNGLSVASVVGAVAGAGLLSVHFVR